MCHGRSHVLCQDVFVQLFNEFDNERVPNRASLVRANGAVALGVPVRGSRWPTVDAEVPLS
jgi:hypothetical protein